MKTLFLSILFLSVGAHAQTIETLDSALMDWELKMNEYIAQEFADKKARQLPAKRQEKIANLAANLHVTIHQDLVERGLLDWSSPLGDWIKLSELQQRLISSLPQDVLRSLVGFLRDASFSEGKHGRPLETTAMIHMIQAEVSLRGSCKEVFILRRVTN